MTKPPNLAHVASAAGSTRRQASPPPPATEPASSPAAKRQPATRVGTKQIAAHFPEDVAWQLRALAVEQRTTVQELVAHALNNLFASYGKPEIAPTDRRRGGRGP